MEQPRRKVSGSERRQRSAQQKTRFTPEEHAELKTRAQAAGMSINSYIRHQALGTAGPRSKKRMPVDQVLVRTLLGELNRVGNNLNQLTRLANMGDLAEGVDVRLLNEGLEQNWDIGDAILTMLDKTR